MPISKSFEKRLYPVMESIVGHFKTPFHLYDEVGIRETAKSLKDAFTEIEIFREYYAVKALPNPHIMKIMKDMGFGFDCSSTSELFLSRSIGATGDKIMFTSNNTSQEEFETALSNGGSIINLDDISMVQKLPFMPELIAFRYNPGPRRTGNSIIGNPVEAKYGVAHEQIIDAYRMAQKRGAKRFGLHTMLASNEMNYSYMVQTADMLLEISKAITHSLNIPIEFINIGGGLGIPYQPDQAPLDLHRMGEEITDRFKAFHKQQGYMPALFMESGRYMTGPHGVLVVKVINRKDTYRTYIGVDACMAALMRPGMYGAYHHITVPGRSQDEYALNMDVVGSLCENNDKFAVQRLLPNLKEEDILVIHDTGAHGHSMGFNYNGKLRPKELLLKSNGTISLIRREETLEDYFQTLHFEKDTLVPVID